MSFNDAQISSLLNSETVHLATLIHFDFKSQPIRLWDGAHTLTTLDGQEWQGMVAHDGSLNASVSGLERFAADTAAPVNFTLTGVDPSVLQKAHESGDDVQGRDAKIYAQFFGQDNTLVGSPILISWLIMDIVRGEMSGPHDRKIELTAETIFASKRRRPTFGLYTYIDQISRFAGDKGFEFVAKMKHKTVTWPAW